MKKIILFFVIILLSIKVQSQEVDPEFIDARQFGVSLSTIGGIGAYYLHPVNEKDNLKLTGIFIYDNSDGYKDSFFSFGGEYQRDIWESYTRRLYGNIGASIDNEFSNDTFFEDFNSEQRYTYFSIGGGVGVDLGERDKGLIFNAHISYQLTQGIGDSESTRIGLGGGVGIGFNF